MSGNGETSRDEEATMERLHEEPPMDFRITGLPAARFSHLFGLTEAELARHRARRYTCDEKPGFPCRVTLEDAEPGESVLLVNFEHLPVDSPYRDLRARTRAAFLR
jgi:hypothetical protein